MAKFNSIEELLALRPNGKKPVRDKTSRPHEYSSLPDQHVKTYKFKRVKNSDCGWEIDEKDQRVDVPGQIDLIEKDGEEDKENVKEKDIFLSTGSLKITGYGRDL